MQTERNERKSRIGVVVSDKMDKTIVVEVENTIIHPMYHKHLKRHTKFHVHDEENVANEGDVVRIMETRKLSKNKRWRLVEVVREAK